MSISTEISRITTDRNTIRTKLQSFGLATATDNLDTLADVIDHMADRGTPQAEVTEGNTYTILAGYYHGGTITGVAGGGNYNLQAKSNLTPTKSQIVVTPDSGYYGLSSVTINPIPAAYQDVSAVTALAANVLSGKTFVPPSGTLTTGTMPNNGSVQRTLDTTMSVSANPSYTNISYNVPAGYHDGTGVIKIVPQDKTVIATSAGATVTADAGKVLHSVTAKIPDEYQDITSQADPSKILEGNSVWYWDDPEGTHKAIWSEGTLHDYSYNSGDGYDETTKTLTIASPLLTVPTGYHEDLQVAIVPQAKNVTLSRSQQTITPDAGKVLSSVVVPAIDSKLQDVSGVTATAAGVLTGTYFVTSAGVKTQGTMPSNGAISKTIDGITTMSASIPAGYTSGGTVTLTDDIENALAAI